MQNQITTNRATMLFNRRVLDLGQIVNLDNDDEDLLELLQFNKIFRSNSDELFEKFINVDIMAEYLSDVTECDRNVQNIIDQLGYVQEINFEGRLSAFRRISGQLTSVRIDPIMLQSDIAWTCGSLYFLSEVANSTDIILTTIAKNNAIYNSPIHYHDDDGEIIGWSTEDCIVDYLTTCFGNTLVIRPTTSKYTGTITRLEFHGDISIIPDTVRWLTTDTVVVESDRIYLDDLSQLIELSIHEDDDSDIYDKIFYRLDDIEAEDERPKIALLDRIFTEDVLFEYPDDDFAGYLTFLRLVSINPDVEKLSICLYRFGDNPILFYLLRECARRGINVTVNIETNASNEPINRFWVRELRAVGANVVNLGRGHHKIHAKLTSVVFKDGRMISQIGTGNYHWKTTTQYNDLSFFTSNLETCTAVEGIFKLMRTSEVPRDMIGDNLIVSGINADARLEELVQSQIELGTAGLIVIKANSFDGSTPFAELLDLAAAAGCRIEMIIRGACTWVPQQLNHNVSIKSIVGDQLEHARVFQFGRNDDAIVYMGSLDIISRKLEHRLEVMVRVTDKNTTAQIMAYLMRYRAGTIGNSWHMRISDSGEVDYCLERR